MGSICGLNSPTGALGVQVGAHDEEMPALDHRADDLVSAARWLCAR